MSLLSMPDIKRRIGPARACYKRFKRELYDIMEAAPLTLTVGMLKAEVMETRLYECVTWAIDQ